MVAANAEDAFAATRPGNKEMGASFVPSTMLLTANIVGFNGRI